MKRSLGWNEKEKKTSKPFKIVYWIAVFITLGKLNLSSGSYLKTKYLKKKTHSKNETEKRKKKYNFFCFEGLWWQFTGELGLFFSRSDLWIFLYLILFENQILFKDSLRFQCDKVFWYWWRFPKFFLGDNVKCRGMFLIKCQRLFGDNWGKCHLLFGDIFIVVKCFFFGCG